MFGPVAKSAKKALSLKKDRVFRLLMVMTILLGWLAGVGAAGVFGLENMYRAWHLSQQTRMSVYISADAGETEVHRLSEGLREVKGVERVERLTRFETLELLAPYFEEDTTFPLPIILDVHVTQNLDRAHFDARVKSYFADAQVDDAREVLRKVAKGVRFVQAVVLAISGVVVVIMAFLVSLTVRAGLRGKKDSLNILQYVGATEGFLIELVTRQVLLRSVYGWLIASTLTCVSVYISCLAWDNLWGYMSWRVWGAAVAAPLALVLMAVLAAWLTTRVVVRENDA